MNTLADATRAILGAASTLTGLALVFAGYLITAFSNLRPTDSAKVKAPYKRDIRLAAVAAGVGVATVGASVWWLTLAHPADSFFAGVVILFGIQLATLLAVAVFTFLRVLR